MEDVLDTLAKPVDEREPVVAIDERPVQLLDTARPGTPMAPGHIARKDYEYVRKGTANVFCIVAPKVGDHLTHATRNRTAPRFADALQRIAAAYPKARTFHLVMDNLNTHCEKSLTRTFGDLEGRRLWRRFTVHHTPRHGSWLNPAEIEFGLWSRECLGRDRVATYAELSRRTRAWNARANSSRRRIKWQFTTADARRVFGYKQGAMHESGHSFCPVTWPDGDLAV